MYNQPLNIMDPLTTLCKIALLHFMPEGTKLAINERLLCIQQVNNYQWLERTVNGDKGIDLANLNHPLMHVIRWYLVDNDEKVTLDEQTFDSIQEITRYAIKGLIKLQTATYKHDLAVNIVIQYFINLLNDSLNNIWKHSECILQEVIVDDLIHSVKKNYDPPIIRYIAQMFLEADKNIHSKNSLIIINCVHQLLVTRDTQFNYLLQNSNNS